MPGVWIHSPVMTSRTHKIAVIAGDGIGQEVIPAGIAALEKAAHAAGVSLEFTDLPWGCDYYARRGRMMDEDGFERLATFDAIYLGAIGDPKVPDHIAVWDLLLPLRQRFQQYVNLRPMRLLAGLTSPLANRGPADIDMVCVRENSEGEYSGVGGRVHVGTRHEVAEQAGIFTRTGIERILRYGFEIASKRPRKLIASATKSNALRHSMVFWDEVAEIVRKDYPAVEYRKYHVDAIAARMVTHPASLDVIVCSNLFGDILTDIGSAISGSLGIAPGANINPDRSYPSMFEPIHGSAPDIAGKGIANPIGAIWAGAMMLDHLGHRDLHDRVLGAVERVIASGKNRTPDLGGQAKTKDLAEAITSEI
jgi:tartrate dehydrogenase/decarboxylase / D-malate dehydrogenase